MIFGLCICKLYITFKKSQNRYLPPLSTYGLFKPVFFYETMFQIILPLRPLVTNLMLHSLQ